MYAYHLRTYLHIRFLYEAEDKMRDLVSHFKNFTSSSAYIWFLWQFCYLWSFLKLLANWKKISKNMAMHVIHSSNTTRLFLSLWTIYGKHYNSLIFVWNCLSMSTLNLNLLFNTLFHNVNIFCQKHKSLNILSIFLLISTWPLSILEVFV